MGGALIVTGSLIVLAIGYVSDFPTKQQPMVIGPMIISVLLPVGFLAVKRITDKRPERIRHDPGGSKGQPPSSVEDRDLTPSVPAAAIELPDQPITDTRTFEFNREKIVYFLFIAMSFSCVGYCVTGLLDPAARSDYEDGRPVGDLFWLVYTNAAVLAAAFVIAVSVIGVVAPGYFLRMEADQLVLGRWRRRVAIPWTVVRRVRIEQGWLVATVEAEDNVKEQAYHINGLNRPGLYYERLRSRFAAGDVALASLSALNGHRRHRREFTMWVERFWGHSMAAAPSATMTTEPDRAVGGDA